MTDDYLVQTLAEYVAGAFAAGDAAIVVATEQHRAALDDRLVGRGVDVRQAREAGIYFSLDARDLLARFTIGASISPTRFAEVVLEELWNDLTRRLSFPLLCAYPAGFFSTDDDSVVHVADISSLHEPRTSAQN